MKEISESELETISGGHRVYECTVVEHKDGRVETVCVEKKHEHPHSHRSL